MTDQDELLPDYQPQKVNLDTIKAEIGFITDDAFKSGVEHGVNAVIARVLDILDGSGEFENAIDYLCDVLKDELGSDMRRDGMELKIRKPPAS